MSTFKVVGAGRVSASSSRHGSSAFVVVGGGQVVDSASIAKVGNDASRGTNWLPPARQRLGTAIVTMPDGSQQTVDVTIDPQYYRFLDEIAQRRLGGVSGQTITDVGTNASNAIQAVADIVPAVAAAQQQADSVATAAIASREVLVAADVPGADDIPVVSLQDTRKGM